MYYQIIETGRLITYVTGNFDLGSCYNIRYYFDDDGTRDLECINKAFMLFLIDSKCVPTTESFTLISIYLLKVSP